MDNNREEEKVSEAAMQIVQYLHNERFTYYGAEEVLKRVGLMISKSINRKVIEEPEGPVDEFGKIKKDPDAEAPGI